MRIDVVTIFPGILDGPLRESLLGRAIAAGVLEVRVHDLRDFTTDRHRSVDDESFGGGPGMVMKPEPFFKAVEHIRQTRGQPGAILLTSPQGRRLTDADAVRLSGLQHVVILCGRYEGIDERVAQHVATETISLGDYVLSGGELAALVVVDAVSRWVPGVVGDEASVEADSFSRGLLDHPHYTRPAAYDGREVPGVLLSGHHADVGVWRKREALARTLARRPDLLEDARLDADERRWLDEWGWSDRIEEKRR